MPTAPSSSSSRRRSRTRSSTSPRSAARPATSTYVHELNAIGSLHVLAAAGEARVSRVILGSTTLVYGARGDNPNFLTEEHPLRPDPQDRFVRDFVEAESHARTHVRRHPEAKVAILRFAPFMSADVRDYRAKALAMPLAVLADGLRPASPGAPHGRRRPGDPPRARRPGGGRRLQHRARGSDSPLDGAAPLRIARRSGSARPGVRALRGRVGARRRALAGHPRPLPPLPLRRRQPQGPQGPRVRAAADDARGRCSRRRGPGGAARGFSTSTSWTRRLASPRITTRRG